MLKLYGASMSRTHRMLWILKELSIPHEHISSGRASASTPAMLMIGSAIGPVVGGTIVKFMGFPPLGIITAVLALAGAACFFVIGRSAVGPVANSARRSIGTLKESAAC